ncbi:MAG: hypothetical protein OXB91_03760 [Bryobacterales bacterium]|nr:hypothetical protein [Bryobacterales bacterium]
MRTLQKYAIAAVAACLLSAAAGANAQDEKPNACEIAAHASRAVDEIVASGEAGGDDSMGLLFLEMLRLETEPCAETPLELRRAGSDLVYNGERTFKEDWYLTCDGCGAIPARHVFPTATRLMADSIDVDGTVPIGVLRMHVNECPFEW